MIKNYFFFLFIGAFGVLFSQDYTATKAKKVPNSLIIHGDTLIDNYYWMRDKYSPEVINHLYAENAYADNVMKESSFLQKVLYEEMKSRRKESYTSRPSKDDGYWYYQKQEKGKNYSVSYRKKDTLNAKEQLILDPNTLAEGYEYISINSEISPDNKWLFYGVDKKGDHIATYYLRNIDEDSLYAEKIENIGGLVWAEDNKTVYYITLEPKTLREYRIYRHVIGRPTTQDELVYEELDKEFSVSINKSRSKKYFFIESSKTTSTEYRYMLADGSAISPTLFINRLPGIEHEGISHYEGDEFYILTKYKALNRRFVKTKITEPSLDKWQDIIPHRDNVLLLRVSFTKDFMFINERENAQDIVRIVNRHTQEETILGSDIFPNEISFGIVDYDYNKSNTLEYSVQNMITPSKVYSYNLYTKEKKIIEEDTILGSFKSKDYETKRVYATARDGSKVPITLAYKKGLQLTGHNPCLLYGYGSYGIYSSAGFSTSELSYLDRGFVYAIAHIRGSNDLGEQWYLDGKWFKKKNTFYDFIDCAEFLIKEKYTNPNKLAINGGSAGGLLMGAVTNMRPDLFKCVVAEVPFVDVINTMLDESLPLTTGEFEEWGNPKKKEYYTYMKSYSPYDNIEAKKYPDILAIAGYNDSQVSYWEPAKWVSKLREYKTDTNLLLLKTNMDAGHSGGSGVTNQFKQNAFKMAFIMKSLGVKENYLTIKGKIVDINNTEIPFANVYIEGTTNGTTSNADGEFIIIAKESNNIVVVVQTLGYIKHREKINITTTTSDLKIILKSENVQLQEVVIKANAKDPAYAIMREAIKHRKQNFEKIKSYSTDVYMRSNVRLNEIPKKLPGFLKVNGTAIDSNDLGMVSLTESVAKYHYQAPDKHKEEMIASKVAGEQRGFSWNRVEDVFINFYESTVYLGYYSERPFVSPLATGSLLNYKYKYLGTFYAENKPVHKIQIIPRRKGDPLFHGELYITEDDYQLYSTDLFVTKDAQIEYVDTVHFKQEMVKVNDSIWTPIQYKVWSNINLFGFKARDVSLASLSNYQINKSFPKKFFNNEIFRIEEQANKKDTAYWSTTRSTVLTEEERKYYYKSDSILKRKDSKEYKDSITKKSKSWKFDLEEGLYRYNPVTGIGQKTGPLYEMVNYNTIEGINIKLKHTLYKYKPEEGRGYKSLESMIRYGVDNKKWSGGLNGNWRFNSQNESVVFLRAGRFMKQYNRDEPIGDFLNTWYTLLDKHNYMKLYQKDVVQLYLYQELANGIYMEADLQYAQREALQNKSFYYWVEQNRHFTSNNPQQPLDYKDSVPFKTHQHLQFEMSFKFIPFAKYETHPDRKILIDTKWPEFSVSYRKGVATSNASFNYDYIEGGIGKNIDLRVLGDFSFDVIGGVFFNADKMNFIDYKHFQGNQTLFLMNKLAYEKTVRTPIKSFHALDYYAQSTNTKYVEYHISHNFRSFFIGKIPLLRKTKIYEIVGVNGLITPTQKYNELFVGIDKIFNVFRIDIGTSLYNNKSNLFYRVGFRLDLF